MPRVGLALILMVGLGLGLAPVGVAGSGSGEQHLAQDMETMSQARALHPGQQRRCGVHRRRSPASKRRHPPRRRGWQRVLRHLKPVLTEALDEAAQSSQTRELESGSAVEAASSQPRVEASGLTQFEQRIEIVVVTPDYTDCRCPQCAGPTKKLRSYYNHPWEADLDHATVLEVYREIRRCRRCRKKFAPELDFVALDGRYTHRVKRIVVASVIEDGMTVSRVPARMRRDFHLPHLSVASVHQWVQAAAGTVPAEGEYTRWVVERFSGVIGLDEVVLHNAQGDKQYLMVAVDALNQRTIVFDLLDSRDHAAVVSFLHKLKAMGIRPEVVITDMWKAYAGALAEVFPDARQQLCVFHVVQDVMKHVNKAFLTYRRSLPKETVTDKALRQELLDLRYTLLTSSHKLSPAQRERVEDLLRQQAGTLLAEAYYLKEAVLTLFRVSRTPEAARQRRDQIVQRFGHLPQLKAVITLLSGQSFEQMIVYLEYENLDKTNNDVERTNRTYQQGEKRRYRARADQTRLNYVRLQARQRNRQNADRHERLKRKPPPAHRINVDTVAQTTVHGLVA